MATEKKTKKDNNKYNKIILAIFVLLLLLIGGTYAWITVTLHSEKTNTIVTGTLSLTLDEHEYIDLSNQKVAIPLSKTDALKQDNNIYRFDLTNDGDIDSEYTIYLDIQNDTGLPTIPNDCIRYILTKDDIDRSDELLSSAKIEQTQGSNYGKIILDSSNYDLSSTVLTPGQTNKYSLRLWIDEKATSEIANHEFKAKLKVVATQTDIE